MLVQHISKVLCLALGARLTQAVPTLKNEGTLTGWTGQNVEHDGTLTQVSDPTYEGNTAIQSTQQYDAGYNERYHSEVKLASAYERGETGYYGFAFQLSADWQFTPAQSYNIAQFIGGFADGCDQYMPATMIWMEGTELNVRVKTGTSCSQDVNIWRSLANVTAGEWHTVVIGAKWEADNSGWFNLWFDGNLVVNEANLATTVMDDRRPFEFRMGLYANGWHDDKKMAGTQGTRVVWYDSFGSGPTFSDANPSSKFVNSFTPNSFTPKSFKPKMSKDCKSKSFERKASKIEGRTQRGP